jgi:putative glycerol-1-phosphate prenyltransferase
MILKTLRQYQQQKKATWAMLIDPDKTNAQQCLDVIARSKDYPPDFFFVGSSLLIDYQNLQIIVSLLKKHTNIPVILFPGSYNHLSAEADAILFLSLISGRNADYLIGNQVLAAPLLKKMPLEIIPTGYILVDGGTQTSVSYISNTNPIPAEKYDIAASTALAGEFLGLQTIYLEAGSGAKNPVQANMIRTVKSQISVPLIVGGGIRHANAFRQAIDAGADVVVTGNVLEKNPALMQDFFAILHN